MMRTMKILPLRRYSSTVSLPSLRTVTTGNSGMPPATGPSPILSVLACTRAGALAALGTLTAAGLPNAAVFPDTLVVAVADAGAVPGASMSGGGWAGANTGFGVAGSVAESCAITLPLNERTMAKNRMRVMAVFSQTVSPSITK